MVQWSVSKREIFIMNFKYIKTFFAITVCSLMLTTSGIYTDSATAQTAVAPIKPAEVTVVDSGTIRALDVVNSPSSYLNKTVTMNAKFDKFSTLGLDYKTALRSSDEYISFLIKRDDTAFDIPFSEMKLFLKREEAEKHIELKSYDEIQIVGTVFSDALGDAWVDVSKIILLKKAPEKKDGV